MFTKLHETGLRYLLVFSKSLLFNNVFLLNSGGHFGCSPYTDYFLALISMYNRFSFQIQVIPYTKVSQNIIISVETNDFHILAAILDAILNFSNCSRVTRWHPADSQCRRPQLSKYVKTFSMYSKSRSTEGSAGLLPFVLS